jgi:membrane protein
VRLAPRKVVTSHRPHHTSAHRNLAAAVTPKLPGILLGRVGKISFGGQTGVGEDRLLAVAAGVVFYGLLAVFPAVTALVSLYGLFASPSHINEHLSLVAGILPQGAVDILREQIGRLTTGNNAKLSAGFIFGLAVALWSANSGVKAVMDALNVVYNEKENRSFIKLNLVSLVFTLAAIGSLLVALSAVVVLPVVLNFLGFQNVTDLFFRLARWPLLLIMIMFGLAALYRYGPSRPEPRWQWISVGSIFAASAWLISSALLSWYLASFANYNQTYGSLGAGIGMMMWMWVSSIVILLGAELNAQIDNQTGRDSTICLWRSRGGNGR